MRVGAGASVVLGALLPHAAAHAAARRRARRSRVRDVARARRARAAEGPLVRDLRARLVPALHPAAVLLRVHQPVPERDRRAGAGGQDDVRADVRDRLHAAAAVRSSRGSASRGSCSSACSRGRCATSLFATATPASGMWMLYARHPAARRLLRLLLRDRADLRRPAGGVRASAPPRRASSHFVTLGVGLVRSASWVSGVVVDAYATAGQPARGDARLAQRSGRCRRWARSSCS